MLGRLTFTGLGQLVGLETLEDAPGNGKGPIPAGTYPLRLSYSARFKALLPEVLTVPGFTGIRLHAGNTHEDTAGCPLVGGYRVGAEGIADSRAALGRVLAAFREWDGTTLVVRDP